MIASVQKDIRPLIAKANGIADEASRPRRSRPRRPRRSTAGDRPRAPRRRDLGRLQQAIITPAREGMAIVAAIRAGLGALGGWRDLRPRHRRPADEEDPLFIG